MYISKKQRANINNVLKPFYLTSNYLDTGLQSLLNFYAKYFARRRYPIQHFLPKYANCRDTYRLTILFSAYNKKYGYAKKRRPATWIFYGDILLTKYGHKKQRKELKRKRKKKRKRRQKKSTHHNQSEKSIVVNALNESHKNDDNNERISELESSASNSVEQNPDENHQNHRSTENDDAQQPDEKTANHNENETVTIDVPEENDSDANVSNTKDDEFSDEPVDNIWNLDIQEVAALITENGNDDEKQLTEEISAADDTNEDSLSNQNPYSEDGEISFGDSGPSNQSGTGEDINEKIRQQLALLKMGKCDKPLFTSKETRSSANTRSTPSTFRRSNSNISDESKKTPSVSPAKSPTYESQSDAIKSNDNVNATQQDCNDQVQKSKSNGGIIDSLFNKFQSIGKVVPVRIKPKTIITETSTVEAPPTTPTPTPTSMPKKRHKRDELTESPLLTAFDLNPDDSNQSTNSITVEFLGFDIANKNVDVSALLPTPKVSNRSNEQAAFVSEYLDTFMKENYLENVNLDIAFKPKRYNADDALMTTDALPPILSVPERPMDMQRPRTLAEKRMILQQHNDIGLLIIENESTVYHELRKRSKLGASYDNTLMRSIQDANIPFTRDCWRAACWLSTSNNRFLYRTIMFDDKEIKLVGSRGNNVEKMALELNVDDKKPYLSKLSKRTLADCPKRCPSLDGIRIHNIDTILNNDKIKTENDFQLNQKYGILRKSRLCMFSREYLTPGPKCKKVHCKSNRKSSFDLEYGPLELVQLPTVQLEVWPQVGVPMPDHIKPILKTIPAKSNVITSEWAKFAVSVVRENPKQVKHRRKYKKPEIEKPQPIIFSIPYENHEKMILIRRRRRSTIIFNESDTKHEQIESFYQNNDESSNQLTFSKNVDPSDTLSMECASILTNMIDSVAIAVNDTNFIKFDPDIDYVGKVVPINGSSKDSTKNGSKGEKDKQSAKNEKPAKSKLMKELKRLNVTVIDTATELAKTKKPDEICQKPFCKLGCVCESIDNAKHIQTHCQRYECMFSCTCINTPSSEPNPFYLNSSIDILQARANARLAKEEKEFKSTIIVSENDMFVLPSSSTATKRSSKKPKRFTNDETCVEDTETETIFKSKRRRQSEKVNPTTECRSIEDQQRCNLLKSLQHVRVELNALPDLSVEPWCMIHMLYKCHCKGRAQKGRIFNFANKKNDMTGPGGWELISPRKRQYTFERDNNNLNAADEPMPKVRKPHAIPDAEESNEPWITSARTSLYNWILRPRRTAHELKMFRNECMFNETQRSELLDQRINQCRKYNQAKNILHKSIENGQLILNAHAKTDDTLNGSMKSIDKTTSVTLDYFNRVITNTMQGLTALQEKNKLSLNPTPNKLSIVPWDRIVHAFNVPEVFIWDIMLKNNLRLLALTTHYTKPQCDHYLKVTNINYADINSLPMIGKLLRGGYRSEKTKYLAVVLLRITHFWRICGVIHSDLKYMDDELRAKPTPDKNPLLGRKINMLYRLLIQRNSLPILENGTPVKAIHDMEIDAQSPSTSSSSSSATSNSKPNGSSLKAKVGNKNERTRVSNEINDAGAADDDDDDDDNGNDDDVVDVSEIHLDESAPYFENVAMCLQLPIPCTMKQRLLMLNVGDDFTHVWFPTWRKFLSQKRIKNSFILAKKLGKAFEMSQRGNNPKVFVSPNHDNCIFIGPYGNNDRQNIGLFRKHDNHMVLSQTYYKQFNETYSKKTKASWIYPSRPKNKQTITLKIDQVYSKDTIPSDLTNESVSMDKSDPNESNQAQTNGYFAAISANGIKSAKDTSVTTTNINDRASISPTPTPGPGPKSKIFIPTKIVEIRPAKPKVWGENQVVQNSCSNTNAMPLKISSVVSGERAALMTNGLPITAEEFADEMNDEITDSGSNKQPEICDVKSLANDAEQQQQQQQQQQKQTNVTSNFDEPNDNACDPMTCTPNKYGDILISTKTEPIDISDDDNDQNDFSNESNINLLNSTQAENMDCQVSGYIYCTTNVQLGKVNLECTSASTIKLYLKEPVDIAYEGWQSQKRQPNLTNVTKYMQTYIREKFYGIYPAYQKFDWIFISSEQFDQDAITLCDFNTLDPFSVVFKDKVIPLSSNYRDDPNLNKADIFVVDIYQLASHLFSEAEVKTMKIGDIIAKSKKIDADLVERQCKLKHLALNFQKTIRKRMVIKNRGEIQQSDDQ